MPAEQRLNALDPLRGCRRIASGMHAIRSADRFLVALERNTALSSPRDRIRRDRGAICIGLHMTSRRPRRLQEVKDDATLRATAGLTPFVTGPDRIGLDPGGGSARRRERRRARPEAEALDSRVLMASGNLATADATATPDLSDRVAQALKPYFDKHQIPGISVAIVTDGQVALAQGYGLSNVATGSPVQADTRFDIGSVTKTFTALGVLLLYQESQGTSQALDLNAPIRKYLHNTPSFKLPPKWSHITTMELLDMTSGIRNVSGARAMAGPSPVDLERPPPLRPGDGVLVQQHQLLPARRAHRAADR